MEPERERKPRARGGDPWRTDQDSTLFLRAVLWTSACLAAPLAAIGVDPPRFRELLRVRILLTQRATSASSKAWGSAGAAIAVVMTWFFGLTTGLIALLGAESGLWVAASSALLMLLLAVLLFQVLVGILVDPTDIGVVAPHPIQDRTVFAVRLAEVATYVLVIVASFTGGSMLLAVFALPPLAVLIVYPLLALCAGVLTLGLVTLLFALCLRIVGPTHFQRVTLWAQILGGVVVFGAVQLPNLIRREQWGLWLEEHAGLRLLLPPFQYAEVFAFASGETPVFPWAAAAAAVLAPVAALGLTFWLASRYFVAGLQGTLGAPAPRSGWERGILQRLGARLGGEQRIGFDFALALARREPHLLRAVLPQLLMFQVMALGSAFGLQRDIEYFLPASAGFLFLVLPNVLLQAQGTPLPEARVLFTTAPLASEEALLRGGVKALLLQWVGAPAVLLFGVQLYVTGLAGLPRVVLAFELAIGFALLFTSFFRLAVPFTQPIRAVESGAANIGLVLMMGLAIVALGGIHFALTRHPLVLAAGIVGSGVLLLFLWRRLEGLRPSEELRLLG